MVNITVGLLGKAGNDCRCPYRFKRSMVDFKKGMDGCMNKIYSVCGIYLPVFIFNYDKIKWLSGYFEVMIKNDGGTDDR